MKSIIRPCLMLFVLLAANNAFSVCSAAKKTDGLYIDHGNGAVTDNETGLMWQQCVLGLSGAGCATGSATTYSWKDALAAVQLANGSNQLGYNDWRLPNVKELSSLVDTGCVGPSLNATLFPSTPIGTWTSTPSQNSVEQDSAFAIQFSYGRIGPMIKNAAFYVRLVRAGN